MENKAREKATGADRYDREDLAKAVEIMRKGGIILYPTDTVWGLGCDATNDEAVRKIYKLKRRADAKSMLVLVASEAELERYVKDVPEAAWMLIEAAVNPLTIIYDTPTGVAASLMSEDGSLGVRITHELFSNHLCARMRVPVVSTSANISGEPTPGKFSEISREIIDGVDYVVNYRQDDDSPHKPSNIIKVGASGTFRIIR